MNWILLSLPLIASFSTLIATVALYLTLREAFKEVKIPEPYREEIDITPISRALGKVFPQPTMKEGSILAEETPQSGDVKLLGTAVGIRGLALLRVGGKTLILEEGEEKEGVKLIEVGRSWAIVSVGGRKVNLRVEKARVPSATQEDLNVGTDVNSHDLKISRREIEMVTKDPGIMFREIRLVPYVKGGKTEGFIFEWIKPGSLFYRAGLRKGDVLVSINNMDIKSGEDAFRILQVLRNEPSLRVVVLRNGQRREINVRIE
ncbi:general secretion pathway protein C [Hydrogenivirga caldilitoris]|uniref:General secretion pathway protein C n=1 Tax=Hydrogenivirga caldilitoris TaxID=246264 RepID=A0A497XN05_9AQUI|nr:type II secretion system protein GspC [Hydrogenivirga caldilitoris]RLJ70336.1 general secretion pathway protein C [Hydrogenivirga caldilitoris]